MLEIRGLTKTFGKLTVLDGVDLAVAPGRVTAVLGPNGAGKTTLIKSVLGLTRPDAGEIRLGGVPVVGPGARGGIDDPIDRQVTLARRARADGVRLVGVADVKRRTIAVGINRGRRDAHFAARSRNAHGDLAAIGYDHFSHERRHCSPAKSRTLHALAR